MKYVIATIIILIAFGYQFTYADGNDDAPLAQARFRPWQQTWQCNDLRVTVTGQSPDTINYDIGGSIWGGINFTVWQGQLYLRGIPCAPLR